MIYAQQIENEILGGVIVAHRPSKTFSIGEQLTAKRGLLPLDKQRPKN